MTLRFSTTDKAGTLHGVKVLVYGPAGVGKTVLSSTAPTPIILSAESGLLSLRKVSIPVVEIKTIDDLNEAYRWATESEEAKDIETVCIDSLTEIAEVILSNAKRQTKDPRQAYGELIDKMLMTVKAFRDLPGKHIYMSSKMEPVKNEITGVSTYVPSMPGTKVGPQLPYLFDEVFRMGTNKTQDGASYRFLQTQPDLQYEAKDRSGALDFLEPPDLGHIINKIMGDQ